MPIANNFPGATSGGAGITKAGTIKVFSNVEDRDEYLLCDGGEIYNTEYPQLEDKCSSYEIFRLCDPVDYGANTFTGFCSANNIFFVSTGTQVLYSYDAKNFQYGFSTTSPLVRACYGNGTYVLIVGTSGAWTAYASTNLSEWTSTSLNNSNNISDFCFGNGMFVFLDYTQATANKNFIYSVDGINWETKTQSLNKYVGSMYFVLGKFYITSGDTYSNYTTTDLQTFTTVSSYNYYQAQEYEGYVYGYAYIDSSPYIIRTTDLVNWENYLVMPTGSRFFINETGIYIPDGSTLYIARDFQTWEVHNNALGSFKASGEHNQVLISDNFYSCYGYNTTTDSNPYITCYLGGNTKQIILPTLNDSTNQIYGYIKTVDSFK